MSQSHSSLPVRSFRHDGWTPERQIAFLDTLAQTRSVTRAAKAAGMSRESAYRLRRRPSAAWFAAAWDQLLKGHRPVTLASRRPARRNGDFPRFSIEGHEPHDPLFSLIGR
jgi:hypothetical protein